jgi:hypothetical protein
LGAIKPMYNWNKTFCSFSMCCKMYYEFISILIDR